MSALFAVQDTIRKARTEPASLNLQSALIACLKADLKQWQAHLISKRLGCLSCGTGFLGRVELTNFLTHVKWL